MSDITNATTQENEVTLPDLDPLASTRELVAAGVAVLDAKFPGWEREVCPNLLRMSSGEYCILGQRFGDFADGEVEVFGDNSFLDDMKAAKCGFLDGYTDPDTNRYVVLTSYTLLDQAWQEELAKRPDTGIDKDCDEDSEDDDDDDYDYDDDFFVDEDDDYDDDEFVDANDTDLGSES